MVNEYALVHGNSGKFLVVHYNDWVENQTIGCVIETSNDVSKLQYEADFQNAYSEFMEQYEQYNF